LRMVPSSPVVAQQSPVVNRVPAVPQKGKPAQSVVMDKGSSNPARRAAAIASLEKERAAQNQRYGIDKRTLQEVGESTKPNRFTQTEALLQLPEIRAKIEKITEVAPYLNIISAAITKEAKYKDNYYAFYHTTENAWRVAQDVYTQLFSYFKTGGKGVDDGFKFLRFGAFKSAPFARDFLLKELESTGLIDDKGKLAAVLLSVNLSLFGNIGVESESSWQYFLREKKHF